MAKKEISNQKKVSVEKAKGKSEGISYRLKCAKTANGLSHFVMYGDVSKEETML